MISFIEFFVVIEVKESGAGWLYDLHQTPLVFYTELIHSLTMSFDHRVFVVSVLVIILNCFIDHKSELDRFLT